MPLDPLLYPNMPGPVQNVMQRQGGLEARIAALESKRDLVVTPFQILVGGSADVPYYGGRLWLAVGGTGFIASAASTGQQQFGVNLRINGVNVPGYTNVWSLSYAVSGTQAATTLPFRTIQHTPSEMANLYSASGTFTLTYALNYATTSAQVSGLAVEWPQA